MKQYVSLEERENAIRQSKREWAYRNKHKRPERNYEREKELRDIRKFSGYYEIVIDGVKSIGYSKDITARCSARLKGHEGDYRILYFSTIKDEVILKELRDTPL
jgi:hypothetical protein